MCDQIWVVDRGAVSLVVGWVMSKEPAEADVPRLEPIVCQSQGGLSPFCEEARQQRHPSRLVRANTAEQALQFVTEAKEKAEDWRKKREAYIARLKDMGLPTQQANAIARSNLDLDIDKLHEISDETLLKVRGLGRKGLVLVRAVTGGSGDA